MRTLALLISITAIAAAAHAADPVIVDCTVPGDIVPEILALCEDTRIGRRVPILDWTTSDCASDFLQRGARTTFRNRARSDANSIADKSVGDAMELFDLNFPSPSILKATRCGDGVIQAEFGEECDDGNNERGDGCTADCLTE